jgi:hypothetical protein
MELANFQLYHLALLATVDVVVRVCLSAPLLSSINTENAKRLLFEPRLQVFDAQRAIVVLVDNVRLL